MAFVCLLLLAPSPARADDLTDAVEGQVAKYREQLTALAAWCDGKGLAEQAQKTRAWLTPHDPNKLYVIILPESLGRPKLPEDAPEAVVQWDARFAQLRREQAKALEALARRAIRAQRASLAFDLVMAALREDPDHEGIRRMLGYQKYRDAWRTLYEINNLRAGQVWHEKFGWLPRAAVRRYEQGQRLSGNRWISAEEDARLHADIKSGWDIETEHYRIRTNHSLEAGVRLGRKLEKLYRVWKQLFIRYYGSQEQVAAMFDGRARGRWIPLPQHKVVYFRNKEEYFRHFKGTFPNIEISTGIYVQAHGTAYFFADAEESDRTLNHEATHQLFCESRTVAPNAASKGNYWIMEGIAMYMETLRDEGEFHVVGGFEDARMLAALYRLLKEDTYVPLTEMVAFNVEKLQKDPRINLLYSQAAGLALFLMHYDHGRYRDALVAYLEAVYLGRDNLNTLSRLTGMGYTDLDRQYREFMAAGLKRLEAGGKRLQIVEDGRPGQDK